MLRAAYNLLAYLSLPFFAVLSVTKKKLRANFIERLCHSTKGDGIRHALWIHAASVGEALIAETLVNYLKRQGDPGTVLITTNTFYTRDMLNKKFSAPHVFVRSLPFDLSCCIDRFIADSTFKALLIIETEIWPNLIWKASHRGIPVIILNGRISDKTFASYRHLSFFIKKVFKDVDLVLAQSEEHRQRFIDIGMDPLRAMNTGNIKYYRYINGIHDNKHEASIITFGSIREKEVGAVLNIVTRLNKAFPSIKYFIAPREFSLINELLETFHGIGHMARFSQCKGEEVIEADIVIVDTVGDLMGIYRRSTLAFVGGSLAPYGGQNILEPLFFGVPVLFGPHMDNFRDISRIVLENEAGIMVADENDLYDNMVFLMENSQFREEMGRRGKLVTGKQNETMEKTVALVMERIGRQ